MSAKRRVGMRILLCGDDGIAAPGLKVLVRIARKLSSDVWVVAPETEQSAASHALTLHLPLRMRKISGHRYAVNGTPTDCIFLAFNKILKDHLPDLVLSGVNRGENVGEDVTYSGTVAAAMESTLLGVPAIALSQAYERGRRVRWRTAERWGLLVVRKLLAVGWPKEVLINVNFPDVPAKAVVGIQVAAQGRHKTGDMLEERVDLRGNPYYWLRDVREEKKGRPGTDLNVTNKHAIAVTPLHLDLTHRPTLRKLRRALE